MQRHNQKHLCSRELSESLAVQLERECGLGREQITCYTFGAPRIGNHAYRQYVAERVPDIWHVINDHDIVAKGIKFGYLYKRCGHRVVVRSSGRLAVRPSFFEFLLLQVRCSGAAALWLSGRRSEHLVCM